MGATFQREPITPELWAEAQKLMQANQAETGAWRDLEFRPAHERYDALERLGLLRVYTARDDGGRLIGYVVMLVSEHLHYAGSLQALQDTIYLHPDHRKGGAGPRLLRHADEQLKSEGVRVVYRQSSERRDIGPLLESMGYQLVERVYARRL